MYAYVWTMHTVPGPLAPVDQVQRTEMAVRVDQKKTLLRMAMFSAGAMTPIVKISVGLELILFWVIWHHCESGRFSTPAPRSGVFKAEIQADGERHTSALGDAPEYDINRTQGDDSHSR